MRKITVLLLTTLALLVVSQTARAQSYVPADEAADRSRINGTRSGKGLSSLALNGQLQEMARGQAVRMANKGDIFHNPSLGGEATQRGLKWNRIGENVGMGPSAEIIYDALLKSPHHYENIIHPSYDSVGVGIVKHDDRIYLVQVFADLNPQVSAPKPVVKAPTAQPAAQPATAAPSAPAPVVRASAPSTPAPVATVDPNAVTGGLVQPVDWQSVLAS
jgi:hypothetical protein